jgi:hypothetical protein
VTIAARASNIRYCRDAGGLVFQTLRGRKLSKTLRGRLDGLLELGIVAAVPCNDWS